MANQFLTADEVTAEIVRPLLDAVRYDVATMQANPTPQMLAAWAKGRPLAVHFPGILGDTVGFAVEVPAPDGWKPTE